MAKTVLIIGGSGFLGTHLALRLRESYKVFATYHSHPFSIPGVSYLPMSISNDAWIKRVVHMTLPEVIIYAAGSNNRELMEKDPREAEKVHTGGPANVSNVSEILQPKFIYLSNCYTFDGRKGNYRESDIVLPDSALGKGKLAGENFIRGKCLNYTIVRSSPIYGRGNGLQATFLDRLRMKLDRGERIELPVKELHSFAPAPGLIDFIARLVETGPRNKILHYGGLTKVTHFELGRAFAQRFGYDPNLILPKHSAHETHVGSGEVPGVDYSLNSTQVAETLKVKPLLLEEGLDLLEQQVVASA